MSSYLYRRLMHEQRTRLRQHAGGPLSTAPTTGSRLALSPVPAARPRDARQTGAS